ALTSCSRVTGVMVTLAASSAFFAAVPHGTCSAQSATFAPGLVRSDRPVTPFGLPFGTAMTSWLRTNVVGVPSPLPASVTVFMLAGAAEANTSAGAPWLIWLASAELAAKLKVTVDPGLAASKSLPIRVNASVSDAAANAVTVPDTAAGVVAAWPPPDVWPPPVWPPPAGWAAPQPATPTVARTASAATAYRIPRILTG